ncbi:MAG: hypothetical protein QM688_09150 [Sphingomonas bacterium]
MALLLAAPVMMAGQTGSAARPDFTAVTRVVAVKRLAAKGELVKILLFPAELGGKPDKENVAYITPQAAADRALAIQTLTQMMHDGVVNQMTVESDYRGDSVIPTRIRMKAWREGNKDSFEQSIEVW